MNLIEKKDFLCENGYGFSSRITDAEDPSTDKIEVTSLYKDNLYVVGIFNSFDSAVEHMWDSYINMKIWNNAEIYASTLFDKQIHISMFRPELVDASNYIEDLFSRDMRYWG